MNKINNFLEAQKLDLIQNCKEVLQNNWRNGFTVPSSNLYPFQWLWDSGFNAMGWSHFNMAHARKEIQTLLDSQWSNGLIAHIVFHDDSAEKLYFPGAEFHGAFHNPHAPAHVKTTGMTQPPVLGFVLEYLYEQETEKEENKDFYIESIKAIVKFHEYLYRERDPHNEGLVYIRHNWESGTDNSATWDEIWKHYTPPVYEVERKDTKHVNHAQRPTKQDYNYYLHLIDLSKQCGYDEQKMFQVLPFLVQCPLFNSVLAASNASLARLSQKLEMSGISEKCKIWNSKTEKGLNEKLWDESLGLYGYYDLRNHTFISIPTAMGFAPLFASMVSKERAERMAKVIQSDDFLGDDLSGFLCPSLAHSHQGFEHNRYWRGPVWMQMNWLIYNGFLNYGFTDVAEKILKDSIEIVLKEGLYEYFSPISTLNEPTGYGGNDFSWTAAVMLDFLNKHIS